MYTYEVQIHLHTRYYFTYTPTRYRIHLRDTFIPTRRYIYNHEIKNIYIPPKRNIYNTTYIYTYDVQQHLLETPYKYDLSTSTE